MINMGFLGRWICISFILLVLLEQSLTISLWFGSDKVKLTDVRVVTLYAGRMTTGRRGSPVPQVKCVGGNAGCNTYVFETVQCYNRGTDGFDAQWECKATMDSSYRFGRTDLHCEGYDHPNDPYVLKGSCGLEYTLDLSNGGFHYMTSYFVTGSLVLGLVLCIAVILTYNHQLSGSEDDKVKGIINPSSEKISTLQPAPQSNIPTIIPNKQRKQINKTTTNIPTPTAPTNNDSQRKDDKISNNRPVQTSFVLAKPLTDFNNNHITSDEIVKNGLQDQVTIIKNSVYQADASNIADFQPNFIKRPQMQEDRSQNPAVYNNFIFVGNNANAADAPDKNITRSCRSKSTGFLDTFMAVKLFSGMAARNTGRVIPTPNPTGTRTTSGFGGTKRR